MTLACGLRLTAVLLVLGNAVVSAQSAPMLDALTVPVEKLPDGCRLEPLAPQPSPRPPVVLPYGTVVSYSPTLIQRFPSNPWSGTDYKYIARVRPTFDKLPQEPDGPPLERADASRMKAKLTGDITEAYYALYHSGPSTTPTTLSAWIRVQAVRYADAKWTTPDPPPPAQTVSRGDIIASLRIIRGSTVILVTGNPETECFRAVRKHIESMK
jgi:hypothetical protein